MNAAGFQATGNGSGNEEGPKPNNVKLDPLYKRSRNELEADYPRLARERFFESLEAYMVILDVEDARSIRNGPTYFMLTPENFEPRLVIYFTYAERQIVLRVVHPYQ